MITSYTRTGLNDVTQLLSPDTGATIKTYDLAGNVKTSKDARGRITTYTHDGINRLTRATYGDNTNTYYYYDEGSNGAGHLTRMVDPGPITTSWSYTPQGRVASKSQALLAGGVARTHTLQYAYNPTTGQLTSITYPSGRLIGLQYGATSKEVETVTVDGQPVASSVTYHPFGGIKRMNLRNGLIWQSALDQDGRITSYTLGGVTYSIQWDSANRSSRSRIRPTPTGAAAMPTTAWTALRASPRRRATRLSTTTPPATCSARWIGSAPTHRSRTPTTSRRPATG